MRGGVIPGFNGAGALRGGYWEWGGKEFLVIGGEGDGRGFMGGLGWRSCLVGMGSFVRHGVRGSAAPARPAWEWDGL